MTLRGEGELSKILISYVYGYCFTERWISWLKQKCIAENGTKKQKKIVIQVAIGTQSKRQNVSTEHQHWEARERSCKYLSVVRIRHEQLHWPGKSFRVSCMFRLRASTYSAISEWTFSLHQLQTETFLLPHMQRSIGYDVVFFIIEI